MTPEQMNRIDRLLAIHLMDYKLVCSPNTIKYPLPYCEDTSGKRFSFRPTRNIAQALGDGGPGTVVGEMKERGYTIDFYQFFNATKFTCRFFDNNNPGSPSKWGDSPIPALAISLAALVALGVEWEEGN